jgi:hypothetical protein
LFEVLLFGWLVGWLVGLKEREREGEQFFIIGESNIHNDKVCGVWVDG